MNDVAAVVGRATAADDVVVQEGIVVLIGEAHRAGDSVLLSRRGSERPGHG